MTIHIKSCNWEGINLGSIEFYSPNVELLEQLSHGKLHGAWWKDYYQPFALLIVDKQKGKTQLIRDHLGQEPFFYYFNDDELIVASSIPEIIEQLGTPTVINRQEIINTLASSYLIIDKYSDETHYQSILRVEPGAVLTIVNQKIIKHKYWELSAECPKIYYRNDADYLEHFNELIHEGVRIMLPDNHMSIAAEFSGGLDSSTVISALRQNHVDPHLFIHTSLKQNDSDESFKAHEVIKHYGLSKVTQVNADKFYLEDVLQKCARVFAGMPHYLFPIGANNVHEAVSNTGHKVLFSGFGGDECVSGHALMRFTLRECLGNNYFSNALNELQQSYVVNGKPIPSQIRLIFTLLTSRFPFLSVSKRTIKELPLRLQHFIHGIIVQPDSSQIEKSVAHFEASLISGYNSRHVRLRIEDSALIGKSYGFSYRYPLLYPKLLEYCNRLPLHMKRRNGINRLIVRNYLSQFLPLSVYQKHDKSGAIMPATVEKMTSEYLDGKYNILFESIPYDKPLEWMLKYNHSNTQAQIIQKILRYTHSLNDK